MARPKGSKNKPKTTTLNAVELQMAKKMGKTPEQLAKEKIKVMRKPRTPKVDWETLAKRLQQALASEIKEHDETKKDLFAHQASIKKAAAKIAIYKTERKMLEELLSDVMTEQEDGNDTV